MRKRLKARRKLRLKPCPFCGAVPQGITYLAWCERWLVECQECRANARMADREEVAAAAWNNRYERSDT